MCVAAKNKKDQAIHNACNDTPPKHKCQTLLTGLLLIKVQLFLLASSVPITLLGQINKYSNLYSFMATFL